MQKRIIAALAFFMLPLMATIGKTYKLESFNKQLAAEINVGERLSFSLSNKRQQVLGNSFICMQTDNGIWGENSKLRKAIMKEVHNTISSPFYKKAEVKDDYKQLLLQFNGFNLEFRMYDDGLAYRFIKTTTTDLIVKNEMAAYVVPKDFTAWVPYAPSRTKKEETTLDEQLWTDHQSRYSYMKLSETVKDKLMINPFVINLDFGEKLCIAESDINDYPGMYLTTHDTQLTTDGKLCAEMVLHSYFAHYPTKVEAGGHGQIEKLVKQRADYIAKVSGKRSFPWRTFIVTANECGLYESDMVYRLATECKLSDISWIKPGKTSWDWWNNSSLYGVDFKAGFNTATYKYFVDFAAKYGLEYILIDEGWFSGKTTDIFDITPNFNLEEILEYASSKGVGIWLWTGFLSLERDLEKAVSYYSKMGVKGFKIDFFNRDDQIMMHFMWNVAEVCARHKMMIDFHGCSKPSGLQRTYPNVLNYEAVFGLEQLRWSKPDLDMVQHDVILPFTRMVAGPMDYTPGAMRNSLKKMYYPNKKNPMSQGTRAHQVAEYVVFDSPFNMLADSPSLYIKEDETTRFISAIPTTWDETKVLDGKIGEYIVISRRKGKNWYIGVLNNWTSRDLEITLPETISEMKIFADGINSHRVAEDYHVSTIRNVSTIKIHLAPGGGWTGMGTND